MNRYQFAAYQYAKAFVAMREAYYALLNGDGLTAQAHEYSATQELLEIDPSVIHEFLTGAEQDAVLTAVDQSIRPHEQAIPVGYRAIYRGIAGTILRVQSTRDGYRYTVNLVTGETIEGLTRAQIGR